MNKKESDRLKAAARQVYKEQYDINNKQIPTMPSGESCCNDYSRYFVWGTAILLVMVFIVI